MDRTTFQVDTSLKQKLISLIRNSYEVKDYLAHKKISINEEECLLDFLNQCPVYALGFFFTNFQSSNPYCPSCQKKEHFQYNEDFPYSFGYSNLLDKLRLDKRIETKKFLSQIAEYRVLDVYRKELNGWDMFFQIYSELHPTFWEKVSPFHKEKIMDGKVFCLCGREKEEKTSELAK